MAGSFEPQMAPFLSGTISTWIHDPNLQPLNIVRLGDTWHVHLNWSMTGSFVPLIDGEWQVKVYAESIGPGKESTRKEILVPVTSEPLVGLTRSYEKVIAITDDKNDKELEGLFRIAVVITIEKDGHPGMIAAFDEGTVMQFFRAD